LSSKVSAIKLFSVYDLFLLHELNQGLEWLCQPYTDLLKQMLTNDLMQGFLVWYCVCRNLQTSKALLESQARALAYSRAPNLFTSAHFIHER